MWKELGEFAKANNEKRSRNKTPKKVWLDQYFAGGK